MIETQSSFMEQAVIYELPDEIFKHIFSYVRLEDFFGLFVTCKKIFTLSRNFELWRSWIERDLYINYEYYLDKIHEKNKIIEDAIQIRSKINPLFDRINEVLATLKVHTDELSKILEDVDDQGSYDIFIPQSYESIDGDFDYLKDNLTSYCNDNAMNEIIEDLFKIDPIALYIQLITENDIIPCIGMVKRPGRKINVPCKEPSVPRKKYCSVCLNNKEKLVMLPKIPSFSNLPGFPFAKPVAIPQLPVYRPPILKIKIFSPGKYVTVDTEPNFVIENINGGYALVGVNDIGLEIRPATYPEKEIAHGLGISISF